MNYRFENCTLDVAARELRRDGVLCPVEPQVFDLLHFLIENRARVVTRDEIFQAVWHGRIVSESVLDSRVNAARTAIGDNGKVQRLIRTFRRKGLRFIGPMRDERSPVGPTAVVPSGPRLAFSFDEAPAIVVLPVAASDDNAAFARDFADGVVRSLSRLGWLLPISGHNVLRDDMDAGKIQRLAVKFGARYLLRSGLRDIEGRTGVTVRLLDRSAGRPIWSQHYDCDSSGVPGIQSELAVKVGRLIGAELYAAEIRRARLKSPESLAAWDCVVRALSFMNTRKKAAVEVACSLLRRAIAIDPKCAPAHALLSFAMTLSIHLAWRGRKAAEPAAIHAACTALDLDRDEPWAHLALGYVKLYGANRPEEALAILHRALELNPSLAIAHYLVGLSYSYIGQTDRTFTHADLADASAPYDLLMCGNTGACDNVRATASWVSGRYREGAAFARKVIAESPRQVPAYRALVINSSLGGEAGYSAAILKKIKGLAPALPGYIKDMESMYSRRIDYQKYVAGFRMAGLPLP